jgi:hypothetical protein
MASTNSQVFCVDEFAHDEPISIPRSRRPGSPMRRLILEEPWSVAALWSRRLGLFALTMGVMAVTLARSGMVDATAALAVFGVAVVVACLALLLGGAGAVVIWRTGRRGAGSIVGGALLVFLLLGYPAWLVVQAVQLPPLTDISTDLLDPPEFARSSRALAAREQIFHGQIPQAAREAQRRAYPGVSPIVLDLDADEAWQIVQKAVAARKWRVVDQVVPGGRIGIGHIDAVYQTLLMGFPQDVTIRVRPLAGQTRIDIRSASRFGRHDFGGNARRIQRFAQELQAQLDVR